MAQIIVRNLDDQTKERLQLRAGRHGVSMEEEVRQIIRETLDKESSNPFGTCIAERFKGLGLDQAIPELKGQGAQLPEWDT